MCLILMLCWTVITIYLINEISIWTPSRNFKVYDVTKDFPFKYLRFNVVNHLPRCDLISSFAMLEYGHHVTTRYNTGMLLQKCFKYNVKHCCQLYNKDFKQNSQSNYFFVDSNKTVFQPNSALNTLTLLRDCL